MNLLKLPEFCDSQQMRNKLLYAVESSAGFELSWGIRQLLDGLETQTRIFGFCCGDQIGNDQNGQTACLCGSTVIWRRCWETDSLKLWHGQIYAQFYFYFKESYLVNNAFINSKQHPLIKSTNIEQEHLNVGDTEGINWQCKIYL